MIELQHQDEPEALARYRRRNPGGNWGTVELRPVKTEIRHALHREQAGLCVYCECKVGPDDGHLEHIKPKGRYPELTLAYKNLAHSCNASNHCGHCKGSREIPIEPRLGCNRFFKLRLRDGRLVPASGLDEEEKKQAASTLEVLGLNCAALCNQREQFVRVVQSLADPLEIEEFLETAQFRWTLQGI